MPKRSAHIEIGFVSFVAAAALTGCNPQAAYHRDWQQCVDHNNIVVEDRLCDQPSPAAGFSPPFYHWLYSARPYYAGQTVLGGYDSPRLSTSVARSSVSRGGFGASAHGSGGGE